MSNQENTKTKNNGNLIMDDGQPAQRALLFSGIKGATPAMEENIMRFSRISIILLVIR
jgi:hypothetical protein